MWLDEYEINNKSKHSTEQQFINSDWSSKQAFQATKDKWMGEYESNIETSFQQNNISYEQWLDMKPAFDKQTFPQTSN